MNKKVVLFVAVLLVVVFVSGCTTGQITNNEETPTQQERDISFLNQQKASLEQEVTTLQEKIASLHKENEDNIEFFRKYSIALNNIHVAFQYLDLAKATFDIVNDYVLSGEYYYDGATPLYDGAIEYVLDAKELTIKAKTGLQKILNDAPNQFFREDVENRIEQATILIGVSDIFHQQINYIINELYEINYGSEAKADEYLDKANDLIPRYNSLLKDLSEVSNKIDLEWDQDWYDEFQGV